MTDWNVLEKSSYPHVCHQYLDCCYHQCYERELCCRFLLRIIMQEFVLHHGIFTSMMLVMDNSID